MTLSEKLNVIQTKLKAPKGQFNSFGKYHYRSCEDILEGIKPLLEETKTTIRLSDEVQAVGNRIYIKATAILSDGETEISTTAYARESESKKGMDDSQVTGTASSYARKYALNGLLAIDDTKDADTLNNSNLNNGCTGTPARKDTPAQQKPAAPKPQLKGEATPEEQEEIKNLFGAKKETGEKVFTPEEVKRYAAMRTEKTAGEVIAIVKAELQKRLNIPQSVQAVVNATGGEVVSTPDEVPHDLF